jgi:hypothetical protein
MQPLLLKFGHLHLNLLDNIYVEPSVDLIALADVPARHDRQNR